MTTRRDFLKKGTLSLAAMTLLNQQLLYSAAPTDAFPSQRPKPADRKFVSKAVEETIARVKKKIRDPKLSWLFENCFPNTLDTTVHFKLADGKPDTFVITGDIHAMWLRDSTAQVWPYLRLCSEDSHLKQMIAGLVNRQTSCILIDPYANAFNDGPGNSEWLSDFTDMKPELHERKWEIDSLCYTVRLAYNYWKTTNDASIFDNKWKKAAALIVKTFKEQQRKDGTTPYKFRRKTDRALDTLSNDGLGSPVKPVGLIVSSFRPSDDASQYGFLIPSNLFATVSLKQIAEISTSVYKDSVFASECINLADEVRSAVMQHAVKKHLDYGEIYAFEVDGFGNALFTDDANVPSLLALPYMDSVPDDDPIYQNTRKFVWSEDNPYFFKGSAAEGIGGPHIGYDMIWHMSIIIRAITSKNTEEIIQCLKMLRNTDANTGFMHESFHKNNPKQFTRKWFAWVNTLFGELILKLEKENLLTEIANVNW
ncbi:MAG: glycoside hydrolase family 125 protein [Prevotellaceae bacterium]|jgi:meiotically up-regulated gene 157 (Mug157) protein|nr:glycoside hydrolase family 125 protein [Prevotellaceae bacterium]